MVLLSSDDQNFTKNKCHAKQTLRLPFNNCKGKSAVELKRIDIIQER